MGHSGTQYRSYSTSSSLIVRARQGDDHAWRKIVRMYGPLVNYWLFRTGLSTADIDDVFQDVFISVAQGIEGFRKDRPGDTFRGWLRTIARTRVADFYRSHQKQVTAAGGSDAFLAMQQIPEPGDQNDAGEAVILHQIRMQALDTVRAEFAERTWQMFWQVTINGRPTRDVAEELGVTPSAVRLAKSRVLRRLREELCEEETLKP